jgi:hypothetical protein
MSSAPDELLTLAQRHIRSLVAVIGRLEEIDAKAELRLIAKQLTRLVFRASPSSK